MPTPNPPAPPSTQPPAALAAASAAASAAGLASGLAPGALPAPGELPPHTANQLGPRRAELSRALRRRLLAAGVSWPEWIDARPGRLQVVLGDVSDPPLGSSAAALAERHGALLLHGLAALGLCAGVSRLVLCASEPATLSRLRALCAATAVEVAALPALYPPAPEAFVDGAGGRAYTVPAAELARIGALVREVAAPQLCTLAGAVARPQVVELTAGGAGPGAAAGSAADGLTPAALVRRCGGARTAAWVAVAGGALGGVLWPADAPLPAGTSLCLILPAAHELVTRLRRGAQWQARARNACLSCQACTDFCPVAQAGVPLLPHQLMRAAARSTDDAAPRAELAAAGAAACTGCGACSVMCPAELLPGALIRALGTAPARPAGAAAPAPEGTAPARRPPGPLVLPPVPAARQRVPLPLLLARLGLSEYTPRS